MLESVGGIEAAGGEREERLAKFELELDLAETEDTLSGSLGFNSDIYELHSMERMAEHLSIVATAVVSSPHAHLCDVSAMSVDEACVVMEEWNETTQPYPEWATAPVLFEDQASRTPDGVAVVFEGVEVLYGELLLMTGRLASRLIEGWGVGADSVVGLCVEKSLEEVCGMVGIMRGGGAYVPLDPKLPVDRLRYLVEQCECATVVSQGKQIECAGALGSDVCNIEDACQSSAATRIQYKFICNYLIMLIPFLLY